MDSDCFFFLNIPFSSTAGFTLTLRREGDLPPITFSATVRARFMWLSTEVLVFSPACFTPLLLSEPEQPQ